MNYRRSIAAVGLAGVLALAACGTDDQVTQPAQEPPGDAVVELPVKVRPAREPSGDADVYVPSAVKPAREPSGDADVYVPSAVKPAREPSGDADVYVPSAVKPAREPSGDADVYVPSAVKPAREPSGDADVYVPSDVKRSAIAPLRMSVRPNLVEQRVSMQVELAALAERDGLTGLSPAFLQRAEVCSGLSPASVSGCTTAELEVALPGNPR